MDYYYNYDISPELIFIPLFFSLAIAAFYVFCMWKCHPRPANRAGRRSSPFTTTWRCWKSSAGSGSGSCCAHPGVNLVSAVVMMLDLAKVFGKDTAFGCLLLPLPMDHDAHPSPWGTLSTWDPIAAQPPPPHPPPPAPTK